MEHMEIARHAANWTICLNSLCNYLVTVPLLRHPTWSSHTMSCCNGHGSVTNGYIVKTHYVTTSNTGMVCCALALDKLAVMRYWFDGCTIACSLSENIAERRYENENEKEQGQEGRLRKSSEREVFGRLFRRLRHPV